jgi:hypothetical protein
MQQFARIELLNWRDDMRIRSTNARAARRIGAITGVITGMVAAGVAVMATPAAAGVNCAAGFHCVFFLEPDSSKHSYFNSDGDFSNDRFSGGNGSGANQIVNNNVDSASNSSTGGFESHYFDGFNGTGTFLFCVNPGATVHLLPSNLQNRASSLVLTGTTTTHCLSN